MIACVDVQYADSSARAGALLFHRWDDDREAGSYVVSVDGSPEPYVPGAFWRRELAAVRLALSVFAPGVIDTVVVDGFAWLADGPGLGARLAAERGCVVVGVAKNPLPSASRYAEVRRGLSQNPLYVSSEGADLYVAAERVRAMRGPHRIPTLLRRVDQLVRGTLP